MDTDDADLRIGVASFMSPYNWESERRVEHLEADGIVAEVVFPNTVPPFYPSSIIGAPAPTTAEEYRLRWAGIKAHNRWMVDFCDAFPGRRAGLAQVFFDDLDDAIEEVRWAKDAGLKGVLIPTDHFGKLVPLFEYRLDPFWAACAELEMPVHRHGIVVSNAETPEDGPQGSGRGDVRRQVVELPRLRAPGSRWGVPTPSRAEVRVHRDPEHLGAAHPA